KSVKKAINVLSSFSFSKFCVTDKNSSIFSKRVCASMVRSFFSIAR
ncbi:hypothetical protein NT04LM_2628a, partial [Listeria monocytogenes FSL F2-208]